MGLVDSPDDELFELGKQVLKGVKNGEERNAV
jgi:hypothetical protein